MSGAVHSSEIVKADAAKFFASSTVVAVARSIMFFSSLSNILNV